MRISEEFDSAQGLLAPYATYDLAQAAALAGQRHVDLRSFTQNDTLSEPLSMIDLDLLPMSVMDTLTMAQLESGLSYRDGEHWTVTSGSGTVAVGPQSDRNNWNGLALTFGVGLNTVASVMTKPTNLLTGFDDNDFVSLAFPGLPISALNLGSCFVDFTSEPSGNFTAGPTASVAFNSSSLVTPLSSGDTEMRFKRGVVAASVDLSAITGVRFRITASATSGTAFRCMAIRLLAKTWVYAPLDINTYHQRLVKPVTPNGQAAATSGFPAATMPVATDWPILLRSAGTASSADDPRPFDVTVGAHLFTGSMTGNNVFELYVREFPHTVVRQDDLDFDGSTSVRQETLDALGRQPDYVSNLLGGASLAWIRVSLAYNASGASITIDDVSLSGYSENLTLPSNTHCFAVAELEENGIRFRILGSNPQGDIFWDNVLYDSLLIVDEGLFERRPGRVGWHASFADGDTYVENIRLRSRYYSEYRTHPFPSITPIVGAQLTAESTSPAQLVTYVAPGPYGGDLSLVTGGGQIGHGYQIVNTGDTNQGLQTNPIYIEDWETLEIEFDVRFPATPSSKLSAFLVGEYTRRIPLDLPNVEPNHWQHVRVRPERGFEAPTGPYTLVIFQTASDAITWYIDNLTVSELSVSWRARAETDDGLDDDSAAPWMNFRTLINDSNYAVMFPQRGSRLQLSGRLIDPTATIQKSSVVPIYAQLGRLTFAAPPVSVVTALFTSSATGLAVLFDGTSSLSSVPVVAWEWDFGDGVAASGPSPHYTYSSAGSYAVTLTAHDQNGNAGSITHTVTVS